MLTSSQPIAELIQQVIDRRKERLPLIESQRQRLASLEGLAQELRSALVDLQQHVPGEPAFTELLQLCDREFGQQEINILKDAIQEVHERVSRNTINIGVSGQARVGKSTLLQQISGLSDEQIPTGSNLPVTAVRSTIHHQEGPGYAEFDMHDWSSFRTKIMEPYFDFMGVDRALIPDSPDGLPKVVKIINGDLSDLHLRFYRMIIAYPTYVSLMTGETKREPLSNIKKLVAYPVPNGDNSPRPYVAVKTARIYCNFPNTSINNLVLMDLPGLGEIGLEIGSFHSPDLRKNVDFVLMVKRAITGVGFWSQSDAEVVDILKEAKGRVKSLGDYVAIVMNVGGTSQENADALKTSLLNDSSQTRDMKLLTWSDISKAHEEVLTPVLRHLAERLPDMDEQVFRGALHDMRERRELMLKAAATIQARVQQATPLTHNAADAIDALTDEIRTKWSVGLNELYNTLDQGAAVKQQYLSRLTEIDKSLEAWSGQGFGMGTNEAWIEHAKKSNVLQRGYMTFIEDQLNRIRNKVAADFASLDHNLDSSMREMWATVAQLLRAHLGPLVPEHAEGRMALIGLLESLKESEADCPHLITTLQNLVDAHVSYRTHLAQFVRPTLRKLSSDVIGSSLLASVNAKGGPLDIVRLLDELRRQTKLLIQEVSKELQAQAELGGRVLKSIIDEFEDQLIRAESSRAELRRVLQAHRYEIAHDFFLKIDGLNNRTRRVHGALEKLRESLKEA